MVEHEVKPVSGLRLAVTKIYDFLVPEKVTVLVRKGDMLRKYDPKDTNAPGSRLLTTRTRMIFE